MRHLSIKFCEDRLSSFYVTLLTNKVKTTYLAHVKMQSKRQAECGKNRFAIHLKLILGKASTVDAMMVSALSVPSLVPAFSDRRWLPRL